MAFISKFIGKPVVQQGGERVGRLLDLIAAASSPGAHPQIVAAVARCQGRSVAIPISEVAVLTVPLILLSRNLADMPAYQTGPNDLFLVRDVLDKQIIDTDGIRVVRVNDLELARVNGGLYVANVDISSMGLLRRLGMERGVSKLAGRLRRKGGPPLVSWDAVELLSSDQPMRLRVPGDKVTELHPADLAEILSDLSRAESGRLLESLDVETLADALEEVEPEFQASLVESMPDQKVADVLEEMAPDEAADLLAELPPDRSEELLKLMNREEAADVRRLLAYDEDTAGGIMTTEYVAIPPNLTAEQAISALRQTAHEAETIFYVYVMDEVQHLIGVFSLQDLVLAQPSTPVTAIMHRRVVTVRLEDPQDAVAQAVAKYNLLAVPVVDDEQRMHGIVTADDALDKIIPTAWKKRLPRLYYS